MLKHSLKISMGEKLAQACSRCSPLFASLKKKKPSYGDVEMIDEDVGLANFIIRVIFQSIVVIMSI